MALNSGTWGGVEPELCFVIDFVWFLCLFSQMDYMIPFSPVCSLACGFLNSRDLPERGSETGCSCGYSDLQEERYFSVFVGCPSSV